VRKSGHFFLHFLNIILFLISFFFEENKFLPPNNIDFPKYMASFFLGGRVYFCGHNKAAKCKKGLAETPDKYIHQLFLFNFFFKCIHFKTKVHHNTKKNKILKTVLTSQLHGSSPVLYE